MEPLNSVAYVNVYDELIESIVRTVRVVPWQVSITTITNYLHGLIKVNANLGTPPLQMIHN